MMHPKPVVISSTTPTKRGHSSIAAAPSEGDATPISKRPALSGGEGGGGEETTSLADSLFSLVTVAEQQRQAQERSGDSVYTGPANHWNPLSCSAPATLSARQTVYPPAERLITFTTSKREYPHLRPVPLQELSSLKLFRAWVRKSFDLKDDCAFILLDKSLEAKDEEDTGLIDSDNKLISAKDIEIVEVAADDERVDKEESPSNATNNTNQTHQDLILYAKSILMFLSEKGNAEARNIVSACPSSFSGSPSSSISELTHPSYPLLPLVPLQSSTNSLSSSSSSTVLPPVLPRILAQAPPCLIPGYYIFSPVFDSFGEKRKLPIKIEIPRALVFNGERYKTVSTYIGLGPFGNDPNSFVKLEGDHLVGTVASRLEDDEEGNANPLGAHVCTYVFKNLRLKTRSLIRTVLDVSYNGMRTGRFFFMVDNEVLPNTSRRFEIKAPSGYTIKMVNKNARSNPVAKHTQPTSPSQPPSQPSSPTSSRPPSPPDMPLSPRAHIPLSHSQPLPPIPAITLPPRPQTPPSLPSSHQSSPTSPQVSSPFPQLQIPPAVLMQMKQKQSELLPGPQSPVQPRNGAQIQAQAAQAQQAQVQAAQQAQVYQQLQSLMAFSQAQQKSSPRGATASPPTMPKGFPTAAIGHPLAPPHPQIAAQPQQVPQQQQQEQHMSQTQQSPQRQIQSPMFQPLSPQAIQQLSQQQVPQFLMQQQRPMMQQQPQQKQMTPTVQPAQTQVQVSQTIPPRQQLVQQIPQPQQSQPLQPQTQHQQHPQQTQLQQIQQQAQQMSLQAQMPQLSAQQMNGHAHATPAIPSTEVPRAAQPPYPTTIHHTPPPPTVLCHRPVIA